MSARLEMSISTVSSSTTSASIGSQESAQYDKVCHSRLQSLTSMTDELDVVTVPQIEGLAISNPALVEDSETAQSSTVSSLNQFHPIPIPSPLEASAYEDDPNVYVNISAIANKRRCDDIDRRSRPPTPDANDIPIRVLPSGWQEFQTAGGRSYYYQPTLGFGQWKPPRGNQLFSSVAFAGRLNNSGSESEETSTSVHENIEPTANDVKPSNQQATTFPVTEPNSAITTSQSPNLDRSTSEEHAEFPVRSHPVGMSQSMISPIQRHISTMTNSVDSGLGRSSISCKNQGFGMLKSTPDPMTDSVMSTDGVASSSNPLDSSYMFPQSNFTSIAVQKGNLDKLKLTDCGVKQKKKEWVTAYAYLASGHLLFYKDQKRAEKCGKHYPPPTDVCDLRGAKVSIIVDQGKIKDKRKKQVVDLLMPNSTQYWFASSSGSDVDIESWYHILRRTIAALPVPKAYPLPLIHENDTLQRRPSDSSQSGKHVYPHSVLALSKGTPTRNSQKSKGKSSKELTDFADPLPNRDSIIERLLRFFRQRPSVEQLRERGIYRPEPIFGSTLTAICQHDHSEVPRFLVEITRVIEEKGLTMDGIYRVSGNLSSIQKIRCHVDQDRYDMLRREDDIHVLTGAVKLFFRELSEPIFPIALNKEFMSAIRQTNVKTKTKAIDELLHRLSVIHRETLKLLLVHLLKVAGSSDKNRMNIHSLAIMFGPALFSADDKPAVRTNSSDDKKQSKKVKNNNRKTCATDTPSPFSLSSEPNQILAYKMIVYGQIIEFILKEFSKFSAFIPVNGAC